MRPKKYYHIILLFLFLFTFFSCTKSNKYKYANDFSKGKLDSLVKIVLQKEEVYWQDSLKWKIELLSSFIKPGLSFQGYDSSKIISSSLNSLRNKMSNEILMRLNYANIDSSLVEIYALYYIVQEELKFPGMPTLPSRKFPIKESKYLYAYDPNNYKWIMLGHQSDDWR